MSLDNIQLPITVLQNLYNKSLFDLKTGKTDTVVSRPAGFSYLGNNHKRIAIILTSEEAIYLPDDELNFLLGILSACRLSMADIALINLAKNSLSYADITEEVNAEKILLFGMGPEAIGLPLQFPPYQVQQYNNQVYLCSASLAELQKDKAEKTKLWNCLKKIFAIA